MGDLIMSIPAIRALKESFQARITVVTSSMAAGAAALIPEIDQVMIYNAAWNREETTPEETFGLISVLRSRAFDAAVIFTVYSQNPLPAALLAFLAGIPRRLAWCRENPYNLLTHWLPDPEPYFHIRHQVVRDLELVASVGATPGDDRLQLSFAPEAWQRAAEKVLSTGVDLDKPWMILHAGVSEKKREYPFGRWLEAAEKILERSERQLILTGTTAEKELVEGLASAVGPSAFALAGKLKLEEFTALIAHAPLVLSVNTATIHIAAATGTPVVVLYALTNPQHTPWRVPFRALPFHPPPELQSSNQVVQYVYRTILKNRPDTASAGNILSAMDELGKLDR
jgi:ADP-heptose:LPS heptosyltransferase